MEIIKEIGALAGLLAFLGLGLLALLYFSQARDLRRLRENAEFLVDNPDADPSQQAEEFRKAELARKAGDRRKRFEERTAGVSGRLPDWRVLVLIAVGALLLVGGLVFGLTRGGGDSASVAPSANGTQVAVLNSTSQAGLAARFAERLKADGYTVSPVGNTERPYTASAVLFSTGNQAKAEAVAKVVDVRTVGPLSADLKPQAKGAVIVVVLGSDKAGGA